MRFHPTTYPPTYPRVASRRLSTVGLEGGKYTQPEIFKRKKTWFHKRHSFGFEASARGRKGGGVAAARAPEGVAQKPWPREGRKCRGWEKGTRSIEMDDRTGVAMPTNYHLRPRALRKRGIGGHPSRGAYLAPPPPTEARAATSLWIFSRDRRPSLESGATLRISFIPRPSAPSALLPHRRGAR